MRVSSTTAVSQQREDAYKTVIGVAIGGSVLTMMSLCLVLPAMYSFIENAGTYSRSDLGFCHDATGDIDLEMGQTKQEMALKLNRTKRTEYSSFSSGSGATFGTPLTFFGPVGFQECPACCKPGVRGPDGDPGIPGMPGSNGPQGALGRQGLTPNASCIPDRIFEPPPCLPCPQGGRGQKGHPGFPGEPGDGGISGRPGQDGASGGRGERGVGGDVGGPGPAGNPGDKGLTPDANVIPGPPGDSGDVGPWGPPGHKGQVGEAGYAGVAGEKGWPGQPGPPGGAGPPGHAGPGGEHGPQGTPGTCVCQDTEVIVEDPNNPGGGYQNGGGYPSDQRSGYLILVDPRRAALERQPTVGGGGAYDSGKAHESNSGVAPPEVRVLPARHVEQANNQQIAYGRS